MVTEPQRSGAPENEFADVAAALGLTAPRVSRRWVNVSSGGHISAVVWGAGSPEAVLVHRSGRDARSLDGLAVALSRPVVAVDLPGAGRSSRATGQRQQLRDLSEALSSFAPRATVIVGEGDAGSVALALAGRHAPVDTVVLLDGLPEPGDETAWTQLGAFDGRVVVASPAGSRLDEASRTELDRRRPDALTVEVPAGADQVGAANALAEVIR